MKIRIETIENGYLVISSTNNPFAGKRKYFCKTTEDVVNTGVKVLQDYAVKLNNVEKYIVDKSLEED